ncbi:DNA cytosine methyltransferase [Nocardia terpenica]|uniref:DNA cytosine methyltransferase n=1 Tax=Nocardia terpenica TaxID=455432 RepID=UPI001931AC63|nr:DNA cytosine methyltransferase [Nocardia terpenica]
MTTKPRLLDLFCKQGGAGLGYHLAGFDVVGVDIEPQPQYPFEFRQADAIEFLKDHHTEFDAFHASPPCQAFSLTRNLGGREYADLLGSVRDAFRRLAGTRPWVIENVPGADLRNPVMVCGSMFYGLQVYRHRLFEASFPVTLPAHRVHYLPVTQMGRASKPGEIIQPVGNFIGTERAKAAMGIDWMTREGLREAIPPAYTHLIGEQMLSHTNTRVPQQAALFAA